MDFIFNRPQPESPDWAMEQQDLATPSTFGQAFGTGAAETTGAIGRFLQESLYEPEGLGARIGRGMVATGELEGGVPPEQRIFGRDLGAAPLPDPVKRPAAEINEQAGAHITDQPMGTNLADLLITAKQKEIERENIWSRYANAHAWPTNLAVGTASFLADPLNAATLFVPGIGEEAILARLGVGLGGRIAAGAGSTALGATAGQLPLAALKYGIGREEASDYDLRSAFVDLAANAVGGAIFGAGFGALGHVLRARGIEAPEAAPRTMVPDLVPETARVLDAGAATHHAALGSAVSALAEGRPVDVAPFFYRPPEAATAIGRAMETPGRAELVAEPTVADQARRIAPETFAQYDPLAARASELHGRIADPEATIGQQIDQRLTELRQRAEQLRSEQTAPATMPPEELRGAIAARTAEFEAMSRQVNELQAARPSMVAAAVAAARQELIPIDARMRDLAPAISAATRQAEGILSAAAAGRRVEMGPPRFGIPRSISPADVVDRLRQLYRDGFAPGVPQAEIDAVRSALAEREAHPPTLPKIEEKPPEGWAAPQTAGEAPGTFRTTVDINGERTVIEGPTRALAKAAAGPEVVTGKQFRQRVAAVGGDLGKASDALVARVEAALGEGRSVTLYAEGKPIKIVSVDRGMMADAKGHRWGTMLLATGDPVGRTRIEIGRKPSAEAAGGREPAAGKTSAEGGKVPAGAPARAAEAIEADPEIAAAEQRFAATQADHPLLPEEQPPLDESRAAVEKASLTEQALQEAADCLKGTGL